MTISILLMTIILLVKPQNYDGDENHDGNDNIDNTDGGS